VTSATGSRTGERDLESDCASRPARSAGRESGSADSSSGSRYVPVSSKLGFQEPEMEQVVVAVRSSDGLPRPAFRTESQPSEYGDRRAVRLDHPRTDPMKSERREAPLQERGHRLGRVPPPPTSPRERVPELRPPVLRMNVEERDGRDEPSRCAVSGHESVPRARAQVPPRERDVLLPGLRPSRRRQEAIHSGVVEQTLQVSSVRPPDEPEFEPSGKDGTDRFRRSEAGNHGAAASPRT
jgi:hypothetical protein